MRQNNWQFDRPQHNAVQYATFMHMWPVLGKRLHTLHCDSHKPQGICTWITYDGNEYNGAGVVLVNQQYGGRRYVIKVKDGVLYAFGLRTNLRRPFKPVIYGKDQEVLNDN